MSGSIDDYKVSSFASLSADIGIINGKTVPGTYTIDITGDISLSGALPEISLAAGVTLDIVGNGFTLDGGGSEAGLFAYQGTVSIDDLTLLNTTITGANGAVGSGGGAGLGGGLFVGSHAAVTLDNVIFTQDGAVGGDGGSTGARNVGGAGGVAGFGKGGVVGRVGGFGQNGANGQGGGFGGGGGGGGGGGAGSIVLTSNKYHEPSIPAGSGGGGGQGGFGGGNGETGQHGVSSVVFYNKITFTTSGRVHTTITEQRNYSASTGRGGGGGGGLGAGGDIFVQGGGKLKVLGGSLGAGTVQGGYGFNNGSSFGSGMFLQGNEAVVLGATAGKTLTIDGVIADENGSESGYGADKGTIVIDGAGTVVLDAANSFSGGIYIDSGTLRLGAAGAAGTGDIVFGNGDPPVLQFSIENAPSNRIDGFVIGDSIDITDLSTSGTNFLTVSPDGVLDIGYGADQTLALTFAAADDGLVFTLNSDGAGGALLTDTAPCFCAGTRILTPRGDIAVEDLAVGDEIITSAGRRPVKWIGRRRLDLARHPRPENVLPIWFEMGALGDNVPSRDLCLSPDHALYIDGVLVPAKALLNGATIRQRVVPSVTYYHVELADHAIIFAENTPAESYLETGNRGAFENGGGAVTLHPDFAQTARAQKSCAPFIEAGPLVEDIRRRILARACIVTTDDPAISIAYHNGTAIIQSRHAIPGLMLPDPRDRRRLGVKIAGIFAGGRSVALDDPALLEGWHDAEPDGRWTDGNAVIPAALLGGAKNVTLRLAATLPYPIAA